MDRAINLKLQFQLSHYSYSIYQPLCKVTGETLLSSRPLGTERQAQGNQNGFSLEKPLGDSPNA